MADDRCHGKEHGADRKAYFGYGVHRLHSVCVHPSRVCRIKRVAALHNSKRFGTPRAGAATHPIACPSCPSISPPAARMPAVTPRRKGLIRAGTVRRVGTIGVVTATS